LDVYTGIEIYARTHTTPNDQQGKLQKGTCNGLVGLKINQLIYQRFKYTFFFGTRFKYTLAKPL